MKRLLILFSSFLWLTSLKAQPAPADSAKKALDQEIVKKATDPSSTTKKTSDYEGFKDLFVTDALGTVAPKLNPRAVSFVQDYISKNSKDLTKLKEWALPFFNMMDGIFIQYNLPKELKYLAVIESKLKPMAVSWAGAVGPWQFMPATATRMGLKVTRSVDERVDYIKSTNAAAKYVSELYNVFGDWLLVIAAYNGGVGNVQKAIRRSGSRNFWDLQYYLPAESRNHVKKFIATHYIFEGQGGMTTLTRAEMKEHYGQNGLYALNRELQPEELANAVTQTVSGKYHSLVIARNIRMEAGEFNRYNPDFDKVMASKNNSYELKLPAEKMQSFNANKYQILNESIQLLLKNATMMKEVSALQQTLVSPKKRAKK